MKSVSRKAAYPNEFKSLVYIYYYYFMWLRISHSMNYKFSFPRYDCTLAKSAIYFVIDTMEVCVYISQKYIIHKYKMKAFNRTCSDIHQTNSCVNYSL